MEPITIQNLSFAYPGQPLLFDHCSLNIDDSWKLGLLGRNGRGKTTLMNILRHKLEYTGRVNSNLQFCYFPLTIDDKNQFTGDALADALPGQLEIWQIERELNFMQVDPALLWQPYSTLSGGEQTKVQLAALFAQDDYFFLLDEPTNHLDQSGRQQIATYLKQKRQGLIITSHDRDFLDQVIDHTLVIERHQIVLNHGNYSSYFEQKKRRDREAIENNQSLKAEIKSLKRNRQQRLQWAQRAEGEKKHNSHADKGFIGAKAAKMMKKTISTSNRITKAINQRQGLLKEVEKIEPLSLNILPSHHSTLLQVDQVALTIDGHQLFKPLSFTVRQHDQIALVGQNGAGKSSLIRAIAGTFKGSVAGKIVVAYGAKISYVRQQYHNHGLLTDFAKQNQLDYEMLLTILRKLGMERRTFQVPIEKMSMGQQKKVEIARALTTPAQLYIFDEPLNYLDTYNQDQLIQLINDFRPPLLFTEHDRHFIQETASQTIRLFPGE